MDNSKMTALNERELENVNGGTVLGLAILALVLYLKNR